MKKKISTWHKNKTAPKKKAEKPEAAHWIQSRARLTKILEASGMMPEKHKTMITCNHDR